MLDPFYFISDDVDLIGRLLPLGVKLVQLRIKDASERDLCNSIRKAKKLCQYYDAQLIINDYWKLAQLEGCDFIHLGQEDLAEIDTETLMNTKLKIGVSTHDEKELDFALSLKNKGLNIAYIALGPIFETRLKKMRFAPQGIARIEQWKSKIGNIPLVAIGGLTPQRAMLALAAGADSAAVVTDISLNQDPENRTKEWIKATEKWRKF